MTKEMKNKEVEKEMKKVQKKIVELDKKIEELREEMKKIESPRPEVQKILTMIAWERIEKFSRSLDLYVSLDRKVKEMILKDIYVSFNTPSITWLSLGDSVGKAVRKAADLVNDNDSKLESVHALIRELIADLKGVMSIKRAVL